MDDRHFDALTRGIAAAPSRRGLIRALAGAALGFVVAAEPGAGRRRRRRKNKKKRTSGGGTGSAPDCTPDCDAIDCGDDGCGGSCGGCDNGLTCRDGECVEECVRDCRGKTCGADGCGGSCGTCAGNQTCQGGSCICVPNCGGRTCGNNGCGGSCGSCSGNATCQNGSCVCVRTCTGKSCGGDGCGGSCGTCPTGSSCQSGSCVCAPNCGGKVCGSDGCGGSCGACGNGETCQGGQCVADPPPPDCAPAVAVEMLNLVNAWRAQRGVTPALALDGILIAAAETRSGDLARTGQLGHVIDGVDTRENLTNHGYPEQNVSWGENLAWGQPTAEAAFTWWKNSPGHNANMLNGNFRALGVGLERKTGTPYTWYWTQTFGSRIVERSGNC